MQAATIAIAADVAFMPVQRPQTRYFIPAHTLMVPADDVIISGICGSTSEPDFIVEVGE